MPYQPLVSIIVVDYKKKNPYLVECLDAIQTQTYKNFEVILVSDYKTDLVYPKLRKKSFGCYVGPAEKRDYGAKIAKGEILAFIDDDAYPDQNWLKNIVPKFKNKNIAGVGGPGVTPPSVSWQEAASGWASASPLGSGPYTYRFLASKKRLVEDYPSMNLAVRKTEFDKVGGYDSDYWPGEDTKLCLDLTHKLEKKIIYEPKALVFHHRRALLLPHLKQNGNFGLHRGYFARILPQTSFKIIYFLPSFFLIYLVFLSFLIPWPLFLYMSLLIANAIWVLQKSKNLLQSILSIPTIFITHLWYGARFIQGFLFTGKLLR